MAEGKSPLGNLIDVYHAMETPAQRDHRDFRRIVWLSILVHGPYALACLALIVGPIWYWSL
jgi:hypothetical protein